MRRGDLEALFTAENAIALATLAGLEVVLGIDNIVFIAILTQKLPLERQAAARRLGLLGVLPLLRGRRGCIEGTGYIGDVRRDIGVAGLIAAAADTTGHGLGIKDGRLQSLNTTKGESTVPTHCGIGGVRVGTATCRAGGSPARSATSARRARSG